MKMIAAVDRNWGIGKGGNLLMHIPEDMEFFKSRTMGNVVVMGRKTFESFPGKKALPGRTNIVLTTNSGWQENGVIAVHSEEELDQILKTYDENSIYIIGGGQIYKKYLHHCDTIYLTHIEAGFQADTYFPDLNADGHYKQEEKLHEGNWQGVSYQIYKWTKK